MRMLSREAILAAPDTKPRKVAVPEWGGEVCVRAITAAEREAMAKDADTSAHGWSAGLAARCLCDEDGHRLFSDKDVAALGNKSATALDRVMKVIQEVNPLGDKEVAALGEASPGTPGAGSPSASPVTSG